MVQAGELAATSFEVVGPFAGARAAAARLVKSKFLVVKDEERFLGVMTLADLAANPRRLVIDCLRAKPGVDAAASLPAAFEKMRGAEEAALPVFRGEDFVGVITCERIAAHLAGACRADADTGAGAGRPSPGAILTAGIAHDFNNIMTVILGNISVVLAQGKLDDEAVATLRDAEKGVISAVSLSRQLLSVSGAGRGREEVIDLGQLVREAVPFYLRGTGVTARFDLTGRPALVRASADRLTQVVGNLTLNAVQAMPRGGALRLALEECDLDGTGGEPLAPGAYVRMAVSDTGRGIPAELLDRVFDPYFTTTEKGTGLGLAIASGIVARAGGHIAVASQEGRGTTFTVLLPRAAGGAEARHEPASVFTPVDPGAPRRRVLVVDDNPDVHRLLGAYLAHIGHDAAACRSGEEAVRLCAEARREGRPFDLAVVDLVIPGGPGGVRVAEELRRCEPGLAVAIASGLVAEPVMREPRRFGLRGALRKPFEFAELRRLLESL